MSHKKEALDELFNCTWRPDLKVMMIYLELNNAAVSRQNRNMFTEHCFGVWTDNFTRKQILNENLTVTQVASRSKNVILKLANR